MLGECTSVFEKGVWKLEGVLNREGVWTRLFRVLRQASRKRTSSYAGGRGGVTRDLARLTVRDFHADQILGG